tara:strand:- start:724 stop:1260 length:537 start_codon:yes stop_codon:yes gene_type:complete
MGWILILNLLAIFFVLAVAVFVILMILPFFGVPWVPTSNKMSRRMFELADLKAGETVVDFGCGEGALLIVAAKEFGANGIGYDHNPTLVLLGRLRARLAGVSDKVKVEQGNFFKLDMPPADLVACYLFPEVQAKLEARLIEAYPSGTRVVSHDFQYPSLKLEKQKKYKKSTVYLYRIP